MRLHDLKPNRARSIAANALVVVTAVAEARRARAAIRAGSRAGSSTRATFEGGQMPYIRRLPKRGFNNARFRTEYVPVNLSDLENHFEDGATVDVCTLKTAGLANGGGKVLVKILGNGKLTKKLTVTAHKFSGAAQKAIEAAGGTCQALNVPKPAPEVEAPAAE